MFIDDGVLVGVNVISKGARRSGSKMREELVLGVEGDNWEGEFLEDGSGWGGRGYDGDRGFNDSRREVLDWDICELDAVDDFFKLKVDVSVLGLIGRGVLKL